MSGQSSPAMTMAITTPIGGREFWTPEEMADQLGTTTVALAHMRSRGGGPPYVKLGRSIVYPVVAVRIWSISNARRSTQ